MKLIKDDTHYWNDGVCTKCKQIMVYGNWGPRTRNSYCAVLNTIGVELTIEELGEFKTNPFKVDDIIGEILRSE